MEAYFLDKEEIEKVVEQRELTIGQQDALHNLLQAYKDIFASDLNELGRTNIIQHSIDTGNEKPVHQKAYRATIPNQEFIHDEI